MSKFRFTYTDNDRTLVFGTNYIANWKDIETNLTRSKSYRGRVRKVTNTFEFVGDLRNNYIMPNFAKNGTNAFATLLIEVCDDNFDEFTYTTIGTGYPMVADFNSYNVIENKVQLNFIDSSFQQKISAGEKEKINITTPNTLDGDSVTDYTTLLKTISMHDRELKLNDISKSIEAPAFYGFDNTFTAVGTTLIKNSDKDIKNTIYANVDTANIPIESYYLLRSDQNKPINLNAVGSFILSGVFLQESEIDAYYTLIVYDSNYNEKSRIEKKVTTLTELPPVLSVRSFRADIDFDYNVDLLENDSIAIGVLLKSWELKAVDLIVNEGDLEYSSSTISSFQRTTSNCILPHEFFTHWIEIMTGRKNSFYSDYFGRIDLGYEQDGEGAYIAIMDGHMIRNLDIVESPLNVKFKDVVEDFIKLKNLIAGIQYIGNAEVFRIEKYNDFYNSNIVVNIGDDINEVELVINEDLTYSKVAVGSKDLELEDLFGLDSAHGELNFSTPLNNIDNELNLVIKAILNDYAIEQIRRKQANISPEEDTKNDKKIFFIDSKPWSTTDIIAKTTEGYTSITGILSPDKIYNINLVPSEQVRLWGNVINGCLLKEQSKELTLTKSASNNTLVREKDNGDIISEKDNIPISELDNPLIINENILVNSPLQKSDYDTIESNTNGLTKFTYKGVDFYSYIDLLGYNISEKNANFTLNRSSR